MAILTQPEVLAKVKVSRSGLYNMIARGEFPRPFKLGLRKNGWTQAQVDAYESERQSQTDALADAR